MGLYGTTGTLQHFFAVHQTAFLSASLVLLLVTGWWGLHKVASASCLADERCAIEEGGAVDDPNTGFPAVVDKEGALP